MTSKLPFWALTVVVLLISKVKSDASSMKCQSTKLVVYQVTFKTFWDRETFPKQYPEWRPPAQWSKLIGFSHRPDYHLFRLGESASLAVKEFAQDGKTGILDKQKTQHTKDGERAEGDFIVLDGFSAPPIESGAGETKANVFLDGNHTRVSLMSKMVPSPDWFVGLDSLNLCENGRFVDTITVEADPIDAGTDNGFTFTAPNWPTTPQAAMFKITHDFPDHPASSFNYPDKSSLPTIASFTFIKEKEYELTEVFDLNNPGAKKQEDKFKYSVDGVEDNSIVTFVPSPAAESTTADYDRSADDIPDLLSAVKMRPKSGYRSSGSPTDFMKKQYQSRFLKKATEKVLKEEKDELYRKLLDTYEARKKMGLSSDLTRKLRRRRKLRRMRHHRKSKRHPINCKVGSWENWSPCSKTCGIGESKRTRTIVRKAKRGGNDCPPLVGMRWCGSARNCHGAYFDW